MDRFNSGSSGNEVMKVVMLGRYPPTGGARSGVEAATFLLASGLARYTESTVRVITLAKDHSYEPACADGVIVETVHSPLVPSTLSAWIDMRSIRCKLTEVGFDVLHIQGQDVYARAACGLSYPSVLTVHGLLSEEVKLLNGARKLPISLVLNSFEQYALTHARNIICISPYVHDRIKFRTRAAMHYVENPVGDPFFSVSRNKIEPHLLFVGGLAPRKGITYLLDAMKMVSERLPQVRLRIVGAPLVRRYAEQLYESVNKLGIQDHVDFLGHLTDQELLVEYSHAYAFILPSLEETAPIAVAQAMAAGVPVLASQVGGLSYMVEPGRTGYLFAPKDTTGIRDAICRVFSDHRGYDYLAKNAASEALSRFSLRSVATKTFSVYEQLVNEEVHGKADSYRHSEY